LFFARFNFHAHKRRINRHAAEYFAVAIKCFNRHAVEPEYSGFEVAAIHTRAQRLNAI